MPAHTVAQQQLLRVVQKPVVRGDRPRASGVPGRAEDVRLFYGVDWTGSWVCLHQGHSLPDLALSGLRFFSPGAGKGQLVNDNVSSHDWGDAC
ncbi:hypothetical protein ABZX98_16795 [Streptomyces sp. NPDC002992]|uniref:hypothetical protein n=1 Tax=Streptomyces sp. NPDC002992 TaxID=3154273 RepID=UPI00339DECA8